MKRELYQLEIREQFQVKNSKEHKRTRKKGDQIINIKQENKQLKIVVMEN